MACTQAYIHVICSIHLLLLVTQELLVVSVVLLDAQSHGNFTLTHQANERSNDGPTEHPKVLKTSWHWDPHLGYVCHEVSED